MAICGVYYISAVVFHCWNFYACLFGEFMEDVMSISWIFIIFAWFIALIEVGRYTTQVTHKMFDTIQTELESIHTMSESLVNCFKQKMRRFIHESIQADVNRFTWSQRPHWIDLDWNKSIQTDSKCVWHVFQRTQNNKIKPHNLQGALIC